MNRHNKTRPQGLGGITRDKCSPGTEVSGRPQLPVKLPPICQYRRETARRRAADDDVCRSPP